MSVQLVNQDEVRYKSNYIGSFTKSLSHNPNDGTCKDTKAFETMRKALSSGKQKHFDRIKLAGGSHKLVDPQASWYNVNIGAKYTDIISKPPPSIKSKEFAAEMIELYCMALLRDVSFNKWDKDHSVDMILLELNKVKKYLLAPIDDNKITANVLFRGNLGNKVKCGPYISQFLYHDIPVGAQSVSQKYKCAYNKKKMNPRNDFPVDFCVNKSAAVHVQDGNNDNAYNISTYRFVKDPRYIHNGRGLAEAVHNDPLYQFYYNAAVILLNLKCPVDPGLPSYDYCNNFTTLGGPADILHHVAAVSGYALKHAWYHKWRVHRRVRPEAAGIMVDNHKNGVKTPLHELLTQSKVIEYNHKMHMDYYNENSYVLSSVYPEGSPCHPSYPAGHAVVAGACCTILKIFFDGNTKWKYDVYESNEDGTVLNLYKKPHNMTVNSELNKLASNVSLGRNWANVHYRSDGDIGMEIGEEVAIYYMKSIMRDCHQTIKRPLILEKFNGEVINIGL